MLYLICLDTLPRDEVRSSENKKSMSEIIGTEQINKFADYNGRRRSVKDSEWEETSENKNDSCVNMKQI